MRHVGRRRTQLVAQAGQGTLQALGLHRFQQIIHRTGVKRIDRILVVGSDKHHVGALADALGHFQAGQARHADVEKYHFRLMLQKAIPGIITVFRHQHDLRLGPAQFQHGDQALAHQWLVFGDHDRGFHAIPSVLVLYGSKISAITPPSSPLRKSRLPAGPPSCCAANCKRLRILSSPRPLPATGAAASRKPTPVSCTRKHNISSTSCAVIWISPPRNAGSIPCLIAFSAKVSTIMLGTVVYARLGGKSRLKCRREPMRACITRRYAATMSNSLCSGTCSLRILARLARKKAIRSAVKAAALGAPCSASCCTAPSVLNKKCGSIWARNKRSCESLSSRAMRSRSASCSSLTASASYWRLRHIATIAIGTIYTKPATSIASPLTRATCSRDRFKGRGSSTAANITPVKTPKIQGNKISIAVLNLFCTILR